MQLIQDTNIKNILIRCTNWVGDCIMTTPAIEVIRSNFPQARISALAKPWVTDVLATNTCIDHIIPYDARYMGLKGQIELARELSRHHFDLAVLLQNAFEAAWLVYLAGIPRRAGYNTDLRGLLLTHKVRLRREVKTKHQVFYYLAMLEGLGLQTFEEPRLVLAASKDNLAWAEKELRSAGVQDDILIGINPGASYGPAKKWLPEYFLEFTRLLMGKIPARIVVFGTAADFQVGEAVSKAAPDKVINMAGRTTLGQAVALITRCHAFVTNDSGLMHVAAALEVPLVAIFGSTNPVTTGPFTKRAKVVRNDIDCSPCLKATCPADFRCMKEIRPQEVFDATLSLLEEK